MPLFAEFRRESYFCLARPSQKVQIGHHKSHHSGKPIFTLLSRPIRSTYRSANQTSSLLIGTKEVDLKSQIVFKRLPGSTPAGNVLSGAEKGVAKDTPPLVCASIAMESCSPSPS